MKSNATLNLLGGGIFLLSSLASTAIADDYYGGYMDMPYDSMGMMNMDGSMGMRQMFGGYMGFGMLSTLNLTEEQEKKINKLHEAMRDSHWKMMGEIMELQKKLRDTYEEDMPDPKAIGELYEKIFQIRKKMIEDRVTTMNKAKELLTDEQRKQLKSGVRRYGWGGGPMMRHRWNYDMDK